MLWRIWRTDNGRWSVGVISCRQSLFRFVSVSLFFSRVSIDSRHILFLRLASYRLRWVRLNGIFYGSFPSFWKYCKLNLNLCTSFSWHRKLLYSYTKRTGILLLLLFGASTRYASDSCIFIRWFRWRYSSLMRVLLCRPARPRAFLLLVMRRKKRQH